MNIEIIKNDELKESIYSMEHESGLKAFIIPRKGYYKKFAAIAANYGSINNEFIPPGNNIPLKVPEGVAHFLEHKLFEQKDGSVMDKFSQLGASPNAYTGFNQTVYLFSCTDGFYDNLKLLLEFVQNPYLTEKSIEKEKGVIGQEIRMYQDNPSWRVFFNLLNAFYRKNPVRIDIAGSLDSIAGINKDLLYKCYNTFYHPSNMMFIASGDIIPEDVFKELKRLIKKQDKQQNILKIYPEKEKHIRADYIEQKLAVSTPLFQIGFMDSSELVKEDGLLKYEAAVKILLDTIMGKSSLLYETLYEKGLINSTFDMDCSFEKEFAFSAAGGESPNPLKVREIISERIEEIRTGGIDEEDFQRSKNAMYGRFIRQFNSIEKISHAFISLYFKDIMLFDYFNIYDKIDYRYAKDVFDSHFRLENMALSVINPLQGGIK